MGLCCVFLCVDLCGLESFNKWDGEVLLMTEHTAVVF